MALKVFHSCICCCDFFLNFFSIIFFPQASIQKLKFACLIRNGQKKTLPRFLHWCNISNYYNHLILRNIFLHFEWCNICFPMYWRNNSNMILNIMGLLGVPKLQNMRNLTKIQHGNVFVNAIKPRERSWERSWELEWEHGSLYVNSIGNVGTCMGTRLGTWRTWERSSGNLL